MKRILVTFAITAIAVTGIAALPTAASASCPSSSLCLYQGTYYTGTMWSYPISTYSQDVPHYVGDGANNKANSFQNNRVHSSFVYYTWPTGSYARCLGPGWNGADLSGWDYFDYTHEQWTNTPMNNNISAFTLTSNQTVC